MKKKQNIYYEVFLRTFIFYIFCVLFSIGLGVAIFIGLPYKILAVIINLLMITPLVVKTIYSIHHLIKYSSLDLINIEEVKLGQAYEINKNFSKFKFLYLGKEYYTLAIFKNRNSGDYTVEKYKDKSLMAGYSKKYNTVFLFKK